MMPMPLAQAQDARLRDDEPAMTAARGIERRPSRSAAHGHLPNASVDMNIQDAAAQALAAAVIPRRHVIFPDPVAFR